MKKTIIAVSLVGMVLFGLAGFVHANPSFFATGVSTNNAASTTPAYLTPGTGTSTTPVYNAYSQTTNGGATYKADTAGVVQQFCASSTATVLTTAVEYSTDGIDWYRNFVFDQSQTGTTSVNRNIVTPYSLSQVFASSSLQGNPIAANNKCSYIAFTIPTPFQYIRIVSSMTGGNGSIWTQLVPVKERP